MTRRLLLDSHVALWWLADDASLGPKSREAIVSAAEVFVSVVTPWELGIKRALGKLDCPDSLADALVDEGFMILAIEAAHAELAPTLPPHHRDPFDRMLIAQALTNRLELVTADNAFGDYDVELVNALA